MKKAATAILAILIIVGALWFLYGQLKSLGYFQGPPPAQTQGMGAEGMPGAAPAQPAAPAEGAPAPATDTTVAP